jgi:hypothetical protein
MASATKTEVAKILLLMDALSELDITSDIDIGDISLSDVNGEPLGVVRWNYDLEMWVFDKN